MVLIVTGLKGILEVLEKDDETGRTLRVVLKYCKDGVINAEEIDEELALMLDHYRLAVLLNSAYGSLSWKMRLFSVVNIEIPYVVRYFLKVYRRKGQIGKVLWRGISAISANLSQKKLQRFLKRWSEDAEI